MIVDREIQWLYLQGEITKEQYKSLMEIGDLVR